MRLGLDRSAIVLAVVVAALIPSACSSGETGNPRPDGASASSSAPTVPINGDANDPVNKLVGSAIAHIQDYWTTQYPKVYDGAAYTPVKGGFYAVDPQTGPLPPCAESASDIAGNAFYCSTKDVVAWDATGLLPDLRKTYGDFVIPVVLAHEWGHAIQARSDFEGITVTREIQADCFSGAWSRQAIDSGEYKVSSADLDRALAGFLSLRDEPGTAADDPSAHGSGFDRINAFQNGYENGPTTCSTYKDGEPAVVELPFSSEADQASGGDAPYQDIIAGVPVDLEDYWSKVYPELTGKPWTPVRKVVPFGATAPTCGDTTAEGYLLFYCVPDNYVGFEDSSMKGFYAEGGDFAVAALLATQWGIAALTQMGDDSDEAMGSQRADCLAGAWTASVLLQNRKESSGYSLSPGDLDEAIKALLTFRGQGDVDRQGAGFIRTEAYRSGVIGGAEPCLAKS